MHFYAIYLYFFYFLSIKEKRFPLIDNFFFHQNILLKKYIRASLKSREALIYIIRYFTFISFYAKRGFKASASLAF